MSDGRARLLFLSRDRGSVQALVPVIRALHGWHRCHVTVVSHSASRTFLEECGISSEPLDEAWMARAPQACMDALVRRANPHAIITGSSPACGSVPETPEQHAIVVARARRVPTLSILDNWGRYQERFALNGQEQSSGVLPDRLCVLDQNCSDDLKNLGVEPSSIRITHNPWLDQFVNEAARAATVKRSSGALRVVFGSQPLAETQQLRRWGFTQFALCQLLLEALPPVSGAVHELQVWPHPVEDARAWQQHVPGRTDVAVTVRASAMARSLDGIDAFVSSHSTAAYEALHRDVPCLALRPGDGTLGVSYVERIGLVPRFTESESLGRHLAAFSPECARAELRAHRDVLTGRGIFFSDGLATQRVIDEIVGLVGLKDRSSVAATS